MARHKSTTTRRDSDRRTSLQVPNNPFDFSYNPPLFILGCGFSHSYCKERFALADDLLGEALRDGRFQEGAMLPILVEELFADGEKINFEKVATFLLQSPFLPVVEHPLNNEVMFQELLGALNHGLGRRDFRQHVASENDQAMQGFVQYLKERQAVVVSLNYDLVLESYLKELGWDPLVGYGLRFHMPFVHGPYPPRFERAPPTLLKLHGSLNWGILPDDFRNVAAAPLYLSHEAYHDPISTVHFQGQHWEPYRCYPYIIPPVVGKSFQHRQIRELWHIARHVLSFCSEIHVIGFSMSDWDTPVEYLFRCVRSEKLKIHLVDPVFSGAARAERLSRFRAVFQAERHGHEIEPHAQDAMEYVRGLGAADVG